MGFKSQAVLLLVGRARKVFTGEVSPEMVSGWMELILVCE